MWYILWIMGTFESFTFFLVLPQCLVFKFSVVFTLSTDTQAARQTQCMLQWSAAFLRKAPGPRSTRRKSMPAPPLTTWYFRSGSCCCRTGKKGNQRKIKRRKRILVEKKKFYQQNKICFVCSNVLGDQQCTGTLFL